MIIKITKRSKSDTRLQARNHEFFRLGEVLGIKASQRTFHLQQMKDRLRRGTFWSFLC